MLPCVLFLPENPGDYPRNSSENGTRGVFFGAFARQIQTFAAENLPEGKQIFLIETCGSPRKGYFSAMEKIAEGKSYRLIGRYECLGFDTFGLFRLVGGLQKGHPTQDEIRKAVEFYQNLQ